MKHCHVIIFYISVIPMVLTHNPRKCEIAPFGCKPSLYIVTFLVRVMMSTTI